MKKPIKQLMISGAMLAAFCASAQMPPPLLNQAAMPVKPAAQADVVKQLETLLACKPGTNFTVKTVQAQLQTLGLAPSKDDRTILLPQGNTVFLFDDEVLAASASGALNQHSITVYLKNKTGKQMAKKFGVTKIDEEANTDEPSYFKQTSKKTTISIVSASELYVGNEIVMNFKSAIGCTLRTS